jgi:hypothetical protein
MREALLGKLLLVLAELPTKELAGLLAEARRRAGARGLQGAPAESAEPGPSERGIAAKVFELLTALDPDGRWRKAPPIKVFNLYYRQRLRPAEIARRCGCNRSLIFSRLAGIRKQLRWSPRLLQEVSPHVEAMEEAVSDSRAEEIHRKMAVYGDEEA